NLSGPGPLANRLDGRRGELFRDGDLKPDLLRELHLDRGPPVGLHPFKLATMALDAAHRNSTHLRPIERLQHVVGPFRTNNGNYQLHHSGSLVIAMDVTTARRRPATKPALCGAL